MYFVFVFVLILYLCLLLVGQNVTDAVICKWGSLFTNSICGEKGPQEPKQKGAAFSLILLPNWIQEYSLIENRWYEDCKAKNLVQIYWTPPKIGHRKQSLGNASHMALSLDDGWAVGYLALSANIATDKILKDISAFMLPRILSSIICCIFCVSTL